jgi:hypothetical protein
VPLNTRTVAQGKRFSLLRETLATLRAAGIQPEVRAAKGSHALVSWRDAAGTRHAVCVSQASSEWHHANARRQLRRLLEGQPA